MATPLYVQRIQCTVRAPLSIAEMESSDRRIGVRMADMSEKQSETPSSARYGYMMPYTSTSGVKLVRLERS